MESSIRSVRLSAALSGAFGTLLLQDRLQAKKSKEWESESDRVSLVEPYLNVNVTYICLAFQ